MAVVLYPGPKERKKKKEKERKKTEHMRSAFSLRSSDLLCVCLS